MFLDISAEEAAKRGGYGTEKYEKKEMQDQVRKLFEVLMESQEKDDFVRIDAGRKLDEVQSDIQKAVRKVIDRLDEHGGALRVVEPWR